MKTKRFLFMVLVMVMSLSLAAPAFAANLDDGDSQVSPQYAVYTVPYRAYLDGLTYLDVTFTVAYKGGSYVFESVDSVALTPMDASTLHWELISYSSQLSSTVCNLTVSRREMVGNTPTGATNTSNIPITIGAVMGGARDGGPAVFSLDTASLTIKVEDVMDFVRESDCGVLSPVSVAVDETYGFAGEPVLIHAE